MSFQSPTEIDDGAGNFTDGWETQFTVAARLMPLRGGEGVMAGRLQGTQPYVCTVRSFSRMHDVTPAWRAVSARSGAPYNITAIVQTEDRAWFEVLVTAGEPS